MLYRIKYLFSTNHNQFVVKLTHWHTQTSLRRPGSLGPLTLRLLMSHTHTHIYIYIYIYMEGLFLMFLDHTQRRSKVGRTPLDE